MAEITYQRLTRDRTTRQFAVASATRESLWLGSDHLLQVQQRGFTETYKRFYFRDIQAITVLKTSRRTVWNAGLAVPVAICLIGFMVSALPSPNTVAMAVWSVFAAIFLLPLVVNNLRGTACTCALRTAVQNEELGSLSRVRQTRNVLDKIRPLIIAAQGQLAPEDVAARMQEALSGAQVTPKPESSWPAAPPVIS